MVFAVLDFAVFGAIFLEVDDPEFAATFTFRVGSTEVFALFLTAFFIKNIVLQVKHNFKEASKAAQIFSTIFLNFSKNLLY